ncbi:arylsulfatase [Radiomyces spectabilis]|uniref:arylsulfatase n=1 Tax=Radiomyces spectabilis TaxID=64574 RepID=UPI002220EE56|nr:arylsulfatase [Radiomyces spectabilis]KAI8367634.1 arylsulfatase [Radiomyces spectabilis]
MLAVATAAKDKEAKKPNIIFIFTDDQDAKLGSLDYMPNLQKHLVKEGTLYRNHYATIAVCCPSRVGLLRGQYAHNTNITSVNAPYGGYDRFNELKLGEDYFPIWMQKAGYTTHYIGKLMNQYAVNNYDKPTPKGFDYQDQLVDPYTYVYNTAVFSTNGQKPVFYNNTYQTDVIHAKARAALKAQRNADKPFFLWVAPMAPHGEFAFGPNGMTTRPAVPAARHAHLFKDAKIPRTPNFNPDHQGKTASYWKHLQKLNATVIEEFDEAYRNRLRALQAVDEMIGTLFDELKKQGTLDNTYVIYSADNGYHIGQHRAYPGKCGNIEEDINVPFIVRGPGVRKGHVSDLVSSHHDIAPTFLALAQGDEHVPSWVDGGVIPLTGDLRNHPKPVSKETFAVEFWGANNMAEGYSNVLNAGPNTYKTLRVISEKHNYMYAVWCTGEHELYDLKKDPYEQHNIYDSAKPQLLNRLDALLTVLKTCKAENCRDPWRVLHPHDASVKTLSDALHKKYDTYYTQFQKISFQECLVYQLSANELPLLGQHFLANKTQGVVQKRDDESSLLQGLISHKSSVIPSPEHVDLFNLVPQANEHVGHAVPDEDFESQAIPVPQSLVDNAVDWSQYGFYQFGN